MQSLSLKALRWSGKGDLPQPPAQKAEAQQTELKWQAWPSPRRIDLYTFRSTCPSNLQEAL